MRGEQAFVLYLVLRWVAKWVMVAGVVLLAGVATVQAVRAEDREAYELTFEAKNAAACYQTLALGRAGGAFEGEDLVEIEAAMAFFRQLINVRSRQLSEQGVEYTPLELFQDGTRLFQMYARQAQKVGRLEEHMDAHVAECERLIERYGRGGA